MSSPTCNLEPSQRPKLTKRPEAAPPPAWALEGTEELQTRPGFVRAALTGGMGTGKSTVAELLTAFGAELIDFDQLARQALLPESPGWSQTVELFGPKIVNADQTLDRAKIASVIFKKPLIRQALEDIVHPLAWDLMRQKLVSLKDSPLIIIDVPLLFEANLNSLFHPIIVSFAAFETQYQRLRARDPHRSRSLTKKMIRAQMPIAEKIRLADAIINNSGSLVQLIRQTKELWRRLTKM